jgi:hypothetical protein
VKTKRFVISLLLTLATKSVSSPFYCKKMIYFIRFFINSAISFLSSVWANHGDEISIQYSGTPALKGDFTRYHLRSEVCKLKIVNPIKNVQLSWLWLSGLVREHIKVSQRTGGMHLLGII